MNNSIKPLLSVIIPVYNEAGSVTKLHTELLTVLLSYGSPYEIIFIDDGSTDNTYERLISLGHIKIIRFRRNFGQTAAIDAGIKAATGEYLAMLDGDGQNDPADIPQLIKKLESENLDVVSGWRKIRRDNFSKRFFSLTAAFVRKLLINDGIHDSGCTLKVYRKECFVGVDLMGEMHRFIPAILKIRGFKVGEMKVNHRARLVGETKYNWRRGLKGILDMISVWFWQKYASRPLHLFGGLGFLFGFVGTFFLITLFVLRSFNLITLADKIWPLIAVFMILMGVNFFISGILADIMVKDYFKNNRREYYSIAETKEQ